MRAEEQDLGFLVAVLSSFPERKEVISQSTPKKFHHPCLKNRHVSAEVS
ncbi:hypothetical protein [Methanosarcina acetivorans]|nr:hypothetical protein [Methanosarcina acetivorans]